MKRLDGRKVIITGGGPGIGQATVARLLDEGGTVVACDVSADGLAATASAAERAGTAGRLRTEILDVSSETDVISVVDKAIADLGGLDVLVNAAAVQRCSGAPIPMSTRSPTGTSRSPST
ncbi:SDR family NAD(P)-dependent oxidoreductase [Streptomyces collinus]|uniref:SDR family NAD(P)-dependent oxidoreductase n=1 Tax=Streptomyces collinus TaxID=42684 RepID=UPI00368D04B4